MAPRFEHAQAEEVRDAFARHGVRYLFIGKSGAILPGYPVTTQDAVLFLDRSEANGSAAVGALRELGFELTEPQADEVRRGKDFVQLRSGPFDLDLVFAPTESRPSSPRGSDASRSRGFPCATRTTSSGARKRPTGPKTANRSRACARSGTTG
jgi:hypothetical protein